MSILLIYSNFDDLPSVFLFDANSIYYNLVNKIDGLVVNLNDEKYSSNCVDLASSISEFIYYMSKSPQETKEMYPDLSICFNKTGTFDKIVKCGFA